MPWRAVLMPWPIVVVVVLSAVALRWRWAAKSYDDELVGRMRSYSRATSGVSTTVNARRTG